MSNFDFDDSKRTWAIVLAEGAPERERAMAEIYGRLATEEAAYRDGILRSMVGAEYALDDEALLSVTESRLRAWLALPQDAAATVAPSYDKAMQSLPAVQAMRRVTAVQTLLNGMPLADQIRLRKIIPAHVAGADAGGMRLAAAPEPKAQPRWAFWRRRQPEAGPPREQHSS